MSVRYEDAGVHIDIAEEITERITRRLGNTLFGGFVPISRIKDYREPVLVSSIDGIGTKVRLAARLGMVDNLGQDIVHHCVNDIAVHGATPLFFLDYLAFHRLDPELVERIVASISKACDALGIRLAGGETAEMPLVYPRGHFDIAGAVVGVVERDEIVDGSTILEGDIVIGLPAHGLHTNGFSLVQEVFADEEYGMYDLVLGTTLGEVLLASHPSYGADIHRLLATGNVHGLAHITGGGIEGNLSRIIPDGLQAGVTLPAALSPLYHLLHSRGIPRDEMPSVFNMGIGLIAVCGASTHHEGWTKLGTISHTDIHERKVLLHDDA